ncbi:TetR/AcrR family transcriptional regulator [Ottowia sp.]|uniref:TetR/AcrR family transcriptional regulator n=1 Tax=Ottowia sp. TaxID=1898956 RepID=UPI00261D9CAF|nr:TetR/AcrR family transcriptional regulator [Ottowia sp.]
MSGVDVYTRVPIELAKCICMYTCAQPLLGIDSKPMNQDERDERHVQIQAAAFALLKEQGYRKTSMLAIAKRAQASNQTLYAWYSNKQALFRGIIEGFGGAAREQLLAALHEDQDPLEALRALGPTLLRFTTDEHAIIMNRAAVIDAAETGVLARAIDEVARDVLYPLIRDLMQRLVAMGVFDAGTDADEAAQSYVALLFGETQLRQALGNLPPFDEAEIAHRAERAFVLTCRLFRVRPAR